MTTQSATTYPQQRRLGIWLDHRIARFVELVGDEVKCSELRSNVERKHRSTGGLRMPGKNYMKSFAASEKNTERARSEHVKRFYAQVLEALTPADRFILLGPGEAKSELAKEIKENQNLMGKLAGVLTAEDMTDRQLVAAVRDFFH